MKLPVWLIAEGTEKEKKDRSMGEIQPPGDNQTMPIDTRAFVDCLVGIVSLPELETLLFHAENIDKLNCIACHRPTFPGNRHAENCPIAMIGQFLIEERIHHEVLRHAHNASKEE